MFHPARCVATTLSLCLMLAWCGACAKIARYAHKRANKAAYGIIEQKQREALGKPGDFTLEDADDPETRELLERAGRLDWGNDEFTTPTTSITLAEALALAVANNRDYKTQREGLLAQALALTADRRDYGPIYDAAGYYRHTRNESGHDTILGTQVEKFGTRGFTAGVNKLFATGAQVGLSYSHQFLRFIEGIPNPHASNDLSLSIVQPLLNGAGPLVTLEPLRQSERDMIYAVRSFRRYQQGFVIDVASRYYGLLSSQDQLINSARNYDSAELNWRRIKRFAEGGKTSQTEVDQARQKVLEAEAGLTSARNDYSRSLDSFKLFLGLPVDLDIGPDRRELEAIAERGLLRPDMSLRKAMAIALAERLDLATTRDQIDDRQRQLKIAEQNFLPTLNAFFDYSTSEGDDKDRVRLDFRDNKMQYGLNLALPMDWTPRRNNYRLAELALSQSQRSLDQERDDVLLEVRNDWRELEEQRTNYRIQQESVRLAERRVKSTSMLLQMGRATARDLLEAQDALLNSRNAATTALVSHTIQRLRFWNAIERLDIDPKGMWYENSKRER